MAKETRFEPGGLGPFQNMFQAYFGALDGAAQGLEPFYKGLARWQLEAIGLVSRRTLAYMEIPSRLSQCRTPQDVAEEQRRFWQTALEQYSDSSRRMMAAWGQIASAPMGLKRSSSEGSRRRDYITFPEPRSTGQAPPAPVERAARERRVA